MPKLAANLNYLFTEVDLLDRFGAAARAGFRGVEYQLPYAYDKRALAARLREHGLDNMAFLISGFAPRFHRPSPRREPVRDVAFVGGPGRRGQRAAFLARIAQEFDTDVDGRHWDRWGGASGSLRVHGQIDNKAYAKICATSKIVLGVNEVNDEAFYCSNRTFLTMACGAFHLTHSVPRLDEVFVDGEHLAYYHDEDDALQKIAEWLPKDDERARVAASGHVVVGRVWIKVRIRDVIEMNTNQRIK